MCDGRSRCVMSSVEEYQSLKHRDRRVLSLDDLTDEDLAAIAKAKVSDEYVFLDKEVED